jgi:hypothetical protein
MTVELHPDAAVSFNASGNSLLARVRQPAAAPQRPKEFSPDLYVSGYITDDDIAGEITRTTIDAAGAELARYFTEGSVELGLEGEDYQQFAKLIESIQRTPAFERSVSQKRLKEVTFDWFRDSRRLATRSTLTEYIAAVCNADIRDYEVAIPIAMLSVEAPLPVGRVVIRPLTKELLDKWFHPRLEKIKTDDERRQMEAYLTRKRKELQGCSAAFVRVRAERTRAEEVAIEEAEAAVGLLRYFAGASLSSRLVCFCVPLGKENVHKFQAILFRDGSLENWTEKVAQTNWSCWTLPTAEINHLRTTQLDALSEIYRDPRTDLHQRIIEAVLLFSRVSIAHDLSDKLVLLFASLESLFLRNQNEPIQQNLADRLALITGSDLAERKEIVLTTKRAYGLRSRFIHHAQAIEDLSVMDKFMVYAWRGIYNIIANRNQFATLDALLEKIDERKLT